MIDKLNPQSSQPLYRQLSQAISSAIECGELPPESKIPTEFELSAKYNISRITVRSAIEELVEEGLLTKLQGKGTYVKNHNRPEIQRNMEDFMGFTEATTKDGYIPSAKLLSVKTKLATKKDVDFFKLAPGASVLVIKRLRLINEVPIMIEINTFPVTMHFLLQENLTGSLYSLLRSHNYYPDKGTKEISIAYADKDMESILDIESGGALLLMYDSIYDIQGNPLHRCKHLIRSDMYKLVVNGAVQYLNIKN